MREFSGRVAVVTGAASGIGAALATTLAREGMKIVLADVEEAALSDTARSLSEAGHDVTPVVTDVTRPGDLQALAQRTLDAYGGVHVLCNNAGVFAAGRSWESPVEDFKWVMDVNVWGVLHGIQAFVPVMLAQGGEAHIVNTSSMAGVTALPFVSAYHMSKHAVMALSESLYKELQAEGGEIGVSVLCPEMIRTNIGHSERNRPSDPTRDPDTRAPNLHRELVEKGIVAAAEAGLSPEIISARVLEAIRNEQFYVLADPDDDWSRMCDVRLDDIRERRNPSQEVPSS